jgi:hypothetical protein
MSLRFEQIPRMQTNMEANALTVDAARPSLQRRRHQAERAFLGGFGVTCEKATVHFAISWLWDAADESKDGSFFPVHALAADLAAEGVRLQDLPPDGVKEVLAQYARRQLLMEFDGVIALHDVPQDEADGATAQPSAQLAPVRAWLHRHELSGLGPAISFAGLARDIATVFPYDLGPIPFPPLWDRICDILEEELQRSGPSATS